MLKLKPKVLLDSEMLKMINEFYSARLGANVVGLECFSDPQLDSHICNIRVQTGDKPCEFCKNKPGKLCRITCHIYYFCLAAYAYRLGIGVRKKDDPQIVIKRNLKDITYEELYPQVMEFWEVGVAERAELEQASREKKEATAKKVEAVQQKLEQDQPVCDEGGNALLTITEAATVYGCSYVNMYALIKRGKFQRVMIAKRTFVRKVEVEKAAESKVKYD